MTKHKFHYETQRQRSILITVNKLFIEFGENIWIYGCACGEVSKIMSVCAYNELSSNTER